MYMENSLHVAGKIATFQTEQNTNSIFKSVELQILTELTKRDIQDVVEAVTHNNTNISSVHPIINIKGFILSPEIGTIINPRIFTAIDQAFRLAQALAKAQGHIIPVILHFSEIFEIWREYTIAYKAAIDRLFSLLYTYPDTAISIENMVPYIYTNKIPTQKYQDPSFLSDNDISKLFTLTRGGYNLDNIKLVKELRHTTPTHIGNRVFVTIDTCHILITQYIAKQLDRADLVPSLTDYFREAEELCNIVHLNNAIGEGLTTSTHSMPFLRSVPQDFQNLTEIIEAVQQYCPKTTLVLEHNEVDYTKNINTNKLKTVESLEEVCANLNCVINYC